MLWFKAFHILSVISWMAALLYLPRLMVYHAEAAAGSEMADRFSVMERRLLRGIATPAMISTWMFGLILAWEIRAWEEGWFRAKVACVLALTAFHAYLSYAVRCFAENRNSRSAKFYRLINEVPTLLMITIVILVVVKPF